MLICCYPSTSWQRDPASRWLNDPATKVMDDSSSMPSSALPPRRWSHPKRSMPHRQSPPRRWSSLLICISINTNPWRRGGGPPNDHHNSFCVNNKACHTTSSHLDTWISYPTGLPWTHSTKIPSPSLSTTSCWIVRSYVKSASDIIEGTSDNHERLLRSYRFAKQNLEAFVGRLVHMIIIYIHHQENNEVQISMDSH